MPIQDYLETRIATLAASQLHSPDETYGRLSLVRTVLGALRVHGDLRRGVTTAMRALAGASFEVRRGAHRELKALVDVKRNAGEGFLTVARVVLP